MRNNNKGFKLIELMVVLIVLAILAAMAVPSFNRSMENAREKEAKTTLELIYNAEKIYRLDKRMYCDSLSNGAFLPYLEDPNQKADYYDFTLAANNPAPPAIQTFTATATRNTNAGGDTSKQFTITQDGNITP